MRTAPRRTALVALAFASGVGLFGAASFAQPGAPAASPAPPTSEALAAARGLFAEALQDEEAGLFAVALRTFEQVRRVRDTASVEYRIASCHEGLGERAQAYRGYRAARSLGQQDPQGAEVSRAASERLDALAKTIARLTLVVPDPAAAGLDVRVDGVPVVPADAEPIALPPGRHVVAATAPGSAPFHAELALAEGAQVSLTVTLEPQSRPSAEPAPSGSGHARTLAGWIVLGGGAALAAASAVLLVVRHDDIAALNRACPDGACPSTADANELEAMRSRALVEGPVGYAIGVAGVAAIGVGLYLVAAKHGSAAVTASLVPLVARGGAGVAFAGAFR
jgi:hypothetical protein